MQKIDVKSKYNNYIILVFIILILQSNYNVIGKYTAIYVFLLTGVLFFATIDTSLLKKDLGFKILIMLGLYMVINNVMFLNLYEGDNIIIRFFTYMIFTYGIILSNIDKLDVFKFLNALIGIGLVDAVLSILQSIFGEKFYIPGIFFPEYIYNFLKQSPYYLTHAGLGLFTSRAYNAIFLLITFNIVFCFFIIKKNKILWICILIFIMSAIGSTYSRIGVTLLMVNIILWISYIFVKKGINKIKYITYISFASMLLYIVSNNNIASTFIDTFSLRLRAIEYDYKARQYFWSQTLRTIEGPIDWLIGKGIGFTGNKEYTVEVHNGYLEIITEIGLIGLIIWILFILRIYYIFIRNITTANSLDPITLCFFICTINNIINCYYGSATGGSIRSGDIIIILPFTLLYIVCKKQLRWVKYEPLN